MTKCVQTTFDSEDVVYKNLIAYCENNSVSMSKLMRKLIREFLDNSVCEK